MMRDCNHTDQIKLLVLPFSISTHKTLQEMGGFCLISYDYGQNILWCVSRLVFLSSKWQPQHWMY